MRASHETTEPTEKTQIESEDEPKISKSQSESDEPTPHKEPSIQDEPMEIAKPSEQEVLEEAEVGPIDREESTENEQTNMSAVDDLTDRQAPKVRLIGR